MEKVVIYALKDGRISRTCSTAIESNHNMKFANLTAKNLKQEQSTSISLSTYLLLHTAAFAIHVQSSFLFR